MSNFSVPQLLSDLLSVSFMGSSNGDDHYLTRRQKESLPADEVVIPHQTEGNPSNQWGCYTSLTGRKSFQSMRLLHLIDRKGFLLADGALIPHLPEGNPSNRWVCYTSLAGRISFRSWEWRLPNPLKHEGWFGAPTPHPPKKKIKKIKTNLMADFGNLEERLPPNNPSNKMGVVGEFLGVVFPTPYFKLIWDQH
jgi:hypothetical protein